MDEIIPLLPYKKPFLFVDELKSVDENHIEGSYQLKEDEYFYSGHFPGMPVTPGVIVTEIMAQIGLVCLGIFLGINEGRISQDVVPVFSASAVDFLKPVYPKDVLVVKSEKIYFRFNKLKCKITAIKRNTEEIVATGEFSGMIIDKDHVRK